jgi:hypothetical protein
MIPNVQDLYKENSDRPVNNFDSFNVLAWPCKVNIDPRDDIWHQVDVSHIVRQGNFNAKDYLYLLMRSKITTFALDRGMIFDAKMVFHVNSKEFDDAMNVSSVNEGLKIFERKVKTFHIQILGGDASIYDEISIGSLPLIRALSGARSREVFYYDNSKCEYVAEIPLLFDVFLGNSKGILLTEWTKSCFSISQVPNYQVPSYFNIEAFVKIRHNADVDLLLHEPYFKKSYHLCLSKRFVEVDDSSRFKIDMLDDMANLAFTPCNGMFFKFVDENGCEVEDSDFVEEVVLAIGDHRYIFSGKQIYANCKKFHALGTETTKKVQFEKDVSFGRGDLTKDVWNYIILNHMDNMRDLKHLLSTCKSLHSIGQLSKTREHILQKVRLPGYFAIPFNNNKLYVDEDVAGNTINIWRYIKLSLSVKVSKEYVGKKMNVLIYFSAYNITFMNEAVLNVRFIH